jgi:hypothetical protein
MKGPKHPLFAAVIRHDDEGLNVVQQLLQGGADVNMEGSPLCYALFEGTLRMVQLLIANGANAYDDEDCILFAVRTEHERKEKIQLLLRSGCIYDPGLYVRDGAAAVDVKRAYSDLGRKRVRTTARLSMTSCGDPIGIMRELGRPLNGPGDDDTAEVIWAWSRLTGQDDAHSLFEFMRSSKDAKLWRLIGRDNLTLRDAFGRTLLHMACQENNAIAVEELIKLGVNPLYTDWQNKLAVDYGSDPAIQARLRNYTSNGPLHWWGPYLMMRATTFALVVQRWRAEGLRHIPRDVVNLIIQRVKLLEYY